MDCGSRGRGGGCCRGRLPFMEGVCDSAFFNVHILGAGVTDGCCIL
jgi:hypothetical protein